MAFTYHNNLFFKKKQPDKCSLCMTMAFCSLKKNLGIIAKNTLNMYIYKNFHLLLRTHHSAISYGLLKLRSCHKLFFKGAIYKKRLYKGMCVATGQHPKA